MSENVFKKVSSVLWISLVFFYSEIVLNLSTVKNLTVTGFFTILFFSITCGLSLTILTSLSTSCKVNRRLKILIQILAMIWYNIAYFIYLTFKIFYDVTTIFAGAADAAGGFSDQIFSMIFSANGIIHILLFALPLILYLIFNHKFDQNKAINIKQFIYGTLSVILSFSAALLCIGSDSSLFNLYTKEYNYQNAVKGFGLLASGVMDLEHANEGKEDVAFETEDTKPEKTSSPEPVQYGYSKMDIDFQSLSDQTDNEALKNMDAYVSSLTPSKENAYTGLFKGKNLIFISAEAFSDHVIDPTLTPTLYRLATKGIQFNDYYQPASAGTTGGEYENIFGLMPTRGGSSLKLTADHNNYMTMGSQLNRLGYDGWAFHANDYTYYSRNITHNNLGYSHGFFGYGNGVEQFVSKQWPQSDLELMQGTLPYYIHDKKPFNIYYMSVSGHNPYSWGGNAMSKKHQEQVQDLPYSDEVKAYIAANLELEDALTYLVQTLEDNHLADDTVIVLSADHFPYGLDNDNSGSLDELYGFHITNYLQRDHNRLILWSGSLEDKDPIQVNTPVSSIDILPTLSNLFGVEWDSRLLPGRDVFSDASPLVFNMNYDWKTDKGTYLSGNGSFTLADGVTMSDEEKNTYVQNISAIVRNKMNYCRGVLENDYYSHVFGPKPPSVEPTPLASPDQSTE